MKTKLSVIFSVALLAFVVLYASTVTSEAENDKNGLGNYCASCSATFDPAPGADVNLYSGSMSIAVPLTSYKGRNGLDLGLTLTYNTQSDQYVGNELWNGGQSSWVGTGWSLSLGSIRYNLKEQKFYLNVPGLQSDKINFVQGMQDFLEYNPYVDIARNQNDITIVDTSGKKYAFGHTRVAPGELKRNTTSFNSSNYANGIADVIDYLDAEYGYAPLGLGYMNGIPVYQGGFSAGFPHEEFPTPLNPGGVQACNYAQDHALYPFYSGTRIFGTGWNPEAFAIQPYQYDLTEIKDISGNTITITYTDRMENMPAYLRKQVFVDIWNVIDYTYECDADGIPGGEMKNCLTGGGCPRPPGTPEYQWTGKDYGCPYYGTCIPDSTAPESPYVDWVSSTGHGIAPGTQYTRTSYINTITDSIGRTVEFHRASRQDFVDPEDYRFVNSNPYQNGEVRYIHGGKQQCRAGECATVWQPYLYDEELLDYIDIKDQSGNLLERIDLEYEYAPTGSESWEKQLLLKKVTRLKPTTGNPETWEKLPSYDFAYGSPAPNFRLREITYPTGGKRTFAYGSTVVDYVDDGTEVLPPVSLSNLKVNEYQISSITDDDGLGNVRTTSYVYDGGNAVHCQFVDHFEDECDGNFEGWQRLVCPEYEYQGFRGCTGDSPYLGYAKVTVNLPENKGKEAHYFYNDLDDSVCTPNGDTCGDISSITNGQHLQDLEYKTEYYDSSNVKVSETVNQYEVFQKYDSVYQRRLLRSDKTQDSVSTTVQSEYNNDNGLPRKTIQHGNDGKQLITYTQYNYEFQPQMAYYNMLSQPLSVAVGDETSTFSPTDPATGGYWGANIFSFTYTPWDDFSPGKYYPLKSTRWNDQDNDGIVENAELLSPTISPTTEFVAYDTYGNLIQLRDSMGGDTYYYYGSPYIACMNDPPTNELRHAYLTCVKNDLNQENRIIYNKPQTYDDYQVGYTINTNNQNTFYTYDAFGRILSVRPPGEDAPVTEYEYYFAKDNGGISANNPNYVKVLSHIDSAKTAESKTSVDGLGKEISAAAIDIEDDEIISKKVYNQLGLVKQQSDAYKPAASETPKWTTIEYENSPLLRPVKSFPLGEDPQTSQVFSTTAYSGDGNYFITTVTDEEGKQARTKVDKLGRTIEVVAALGTADQAKTVTSFNDVAGRSVDVTVDPDSTAGNGNEQVSKKRSDSLGAVRTEQNPDYGLRRNLKFNPAGQVTVAGDGCSGDINQFTGPPSSYQCARMTGYGYDELNRIECIKYGLTGNEAEAWDGTSCTGNHVYYSYDNYINSPCAPSDPALNNTVGRLNRISDHYNKQNPYNVCYQYDAKGKLRKEIRTIDNTVFMLQYTYDDAGNLVKLQYPNGEYVKYDYDELNRIRGVNINNKVYNPSFEYMDAGAFEPDWYNPPHTSLGWSHLWLNGQCSYSVNEISSDAHKGKKSLHLRISANDCGVYQIIGLDEGQGGQKLVAWLKVVTSGNGDERMALKTWNTQTQAGDQILVAGTNGQFLKSQFTTTGSFDEIQLKGTGLTGGEYIDVYIDAVEVTPSTNAIFSSTSYEYNSDGSLKEQIYGNSVVTDYEYTPRKFVNEIFTSNYYQIPSGQQNGYAKEFKEIYGYDDAGNMLSIDEYDNTEEPVADVHRRTEYFYDSLYRLKSATPVDLGEGLEQSGRYYQTVSYNYDLIGNLLQMNNVYFTPYSGKNQIQTMRTDVDDEQMQDPTVTYTYDAYGNLQSETGWEEVKVMNVGAGEGVNNEFWLYGIDAASGSTIRVMYYANTPTLATYGGPWTWQNIQVLTYTGSLGPYWEQNPADKYKTYARLTLPIPDPGIVAVPQYFRAFKQKTTTYCFDQANRLRHWWDNSGNCMKFDYDDKGNRIKKAEFKNGDQYATFTEYISQGNNIIYERTYQNTLTCPSQCS